MNKKKEIKVKKKEIKKKIEIKQNKTNEKQDIVRTRNEENKKIKQFERIQNRENKNEDNVDMNFFFEKALAENERMVDGSHLHEIENDFLSDYEGEFEMIGDVIIGEHVRKSHIRFRNFNEYEDYIIPIRISNMILKRVFLLVLFLN